MKHKQNPMRSKHIRDLISILPDDKIQLLYKIIDKAPLTPPEQKVLASLLQHALIEEIEDSYEMYHTKKNPSDSSSLLYYICFYGNTKGTILYSEYQKTLRARNFKRWETREKRRDNSAFCPEFWVEKHGYTYEDAVEKLRTQSSSNMHKSNSVMRNAGGKRKIKIENVMKELDIGWNEAAIVFAGRQARGKAFFINRYGAEEGLTKWKKRTENWLDSFNKSRNGPWSRAEKNFIQQVVDRYSLEDYNTQYVLYDKRETRSYAYDYCDLDKKLIIEYNGYAYHPSPKLTEEKKLNWHNPFSKEIDYNFQYTRDMRKKEIAELAGFTFLVFWEDFTQDEIAQFFKDLDIIYGRTNSTN